MLEGISKNIISAMPIVSTGCYVAAGAVAGKNIISAGVCKAGATVLGLMGKPNAEWNKSSHDYFSKAKKECFKDLTKAAGFVALGLGASYAGEALKEVPKPDLSVVHNWQTVAIGTAAIIGAFALRGGYLGALNVINTAIKNG